LRFKLTFFYTAIFTGLIAVMFTIAYYLLSQDLESTATTELLERGSALRGYFRFEDGKPVLPAGEGDFEIAAFIRTASRYMQIYDLESGELVTQSPDLNILGFSFTRREVDGISKEPALVKVDTDKGRFLFFNDRLVGADGHAFFLQVGEPLEPSDEALRRFARLALLLLPLGVLLAGTSGYVMAGRALSPIRTMAKTAQDIEVANLDRRLPLLHNNDDLDRLARTFNDMLDRLQHAVSEMRQFTSSIAHELRTPLTALRGEAEVALLQAKSIDDYRGLIGSQLEEFEKLTRLINQLLTLARAESGELRLDIRTFDAAALLDDVVETFLPVAAEKGIKIHFDAQQKISIDGDPQWIERAVVNLLDNAIKYTQEGGTVWVDLAQGPHDSRIEIRDNGIGIPQSAVAHIFDRFYRADSARGKEIDGVGLGLSLVKWIVDRHGGTIEVNTRVGAGSSFVLHLPRGAGKEH